MQIGLRSCGAFFVKQYPHTARAFSFKFRYDPHQADHRERNDVGSNHRGQLKIWGRANSVNVQKVLWCLSELDLAYERIDAGMAFGRNNEPDYLAMNPNGRVPTMVDGDFVLWESNSIMRYLVLAYAKPSPIYPEEPKRRAGVDRWLDWTLSTLQPVDRPVFWALVRTPSAQRDMVAIQKDADAEATVWRIANAQLATRRFIEGDDFTIADIAIGAYARRWFGVEGVTKPRFAHLERWFAQFSERPGFKQFIAPPMS
jgi:glutathione S-transferase